VAHDRRRSYYALEGLFLELWLCDAAHVKNVPGRKADLSDAEWLADVAAHGMVRPSFVPPPEIRELRELTRYRKTQADAREREIRVSPSLRIIGLGRRTRSNRVGQHARQLLGLPCAKDGHSKARLTAAQEVRRTVGQSLYLNQKLIFRPPRHVGLRIAAPACNACALDLQVPSPQLVNGLFR